MNSVKELNEMLNLINLVVNNFNHLENVNNLTNSIVNMITTINSNQDDTITTTTTTSTTTTMSTLQLHKVLNSLILPLLTSSTTTVTTSSRTNKNQITVTAQELSNYFITSLYSTLNLIPSTSTSSTTNSSSLISDAIIDVVWQLDQDLDSGLMQFFTPSTGLVLDEGVEIMEVEEDEKVFEAKKKLKLDQISKLEKEGRMKLAELVKRLTTAGVISTQDCLERLELSFLALPNLNLIPNQTLFNRTEIRARTALFFKQQKFNLLREESEGYSKLTVEILTNMGPPHSSVDARSVESIDERKKRAQLVGDSIKSLIGNFDLDPDRTLDIILDAFSAQIVQHHQFFIDLLMASPWAPKQIPTATNDGSESNAKGKSKAPIIDVGIEDDSGSFLISQILGFKFAYYQGVGVEKAPEKIYLMTALLIWHGFVKIGDIWPHLSPEDSVLSAMDGKYRDEQAKLVSAVGGSNALASAAALLDDDPPTKSTTTDSSSKKASTAAAAVAAAAAAAIPRELPYQKLALLQALLSLGDVTHAFFILAQFPHVVPAQVEIIDLLNRLLSQSVEGAYEGISLKTSQKEYQQDFTEAKKPWTTSTTSTTTSASFSTPVPKLPLAQPVYLSGRAFNPPPRQYTFFFAEWKERLPKCTDFDEVLTLLETYLPFLGVFITKDFSLYTKVCRIARNDIHYSKDSVREARWLELFRLYLLPGISLLEHHSVASIEVWKVLSLFPLETRYKLYGEWKDVMYRKVPALSVRKAEAERDIKNTLRRLSTENVKTLGKVVAKIAHTNPTVVFSVALNQVQSYDNLIVPVVEAARYLSELGFDIFTFSLLDALCSGKNKTKDDGTSVALWLQGLATFVGQFYRRWQNASPSLWVVLQYLVNQLVAGNSKDLVVLTEIISRMTGLEPFADLSDAQVMSLAGGPSLRAQVFTRTDITEAKESASKAVTEKAKDRLVKSLKDSGLAMPLLVNVAIQLQACVSDTEAHLKSLGGLYDQCRAALFQFMEFLSISYGREELAAILPDVAVLMEKFGIQAAVAFDIARPKLQLAVQAYDEKDKAADAKRKADVTARLAQAKAGASTSDGIKIEEIKVEGSSTPSSSSGDLVMNDAPASPAAKAFPPSIWNLGLVDVIQSMNTILPEPVVALMGSAFFVTFWQLTLRDIHYPKDRYNAESARISALSKEVNASSTLNSNEKSNFSLGVTKIAKDLANEASQHIGLIAATNRRLTREKSSWFSHANTKEAQEALKDQLVQYCIQPRAKASLIDAVYTHQLLKKMHMMNTTSFHTIRIYQSILGEQLAPILFSCTENEARNYAQFLHNLLRDVSRWYKDEALYQSEFIGAQLHGALVNLTDIGSKVITTASFVPFHKYQNLVTKWSQHMLLAFEQSFASGEYMHIKNSILVLTKLAPYYPIKYNTGVKLEDAVSQLLKVETREDLKILAQGYKAILSKRKSQWLDAPVAKADPRIELKKDIKVESRPTSTPGTPLRNGQTPSNSSSVSSSIPVGPKHNLPTRPGQNGNSTPASRPLPTPTSRSSGEVDKSTDMDVDSSVVAIPTVVATQVSSVLKEPSGPPPKMHSSLPVRPGKEKNSAPTTTSNSNPADILRQQVIDSQQGRRPLASKMDPPSIPPTSATSTSTRNDSKDSSPRSNRRDPAPLNSTNSTSVSGSRANVNDTSRPSSSTSNSANDNRTSNNKDNRSSNNNNNDNRSSNDKNRAESASSSSRDHTGSNRSSRRRSRDRSPYERESKTVQDDRDDRDKPGKGRNRDDRDKNSSYSESRSRRSDRKEDGEVDTSRSRHSNSSSRDSKNGGYDQEREGDTSNKDSRTNERDKARDSSNRTRDDRDRDNNHNNNSSNNNNNNKGRNDSSYPKRAPDTSRSSQPSTGPRDNLSRNNPASTSDRRLEATSQSIDRLKPPPSSKFTPAIPKNSDANSTSTSSASNISIQNSLNSDPTSTSNSARPSLSHNNSSDGPSKLNFSVRGRSSDAGSKMMIDAVSSASSASSRRPSTNKDKDSDRDGTERYGDREAEGKKRTADLLDRLGGDSSKNDYQDNKRSRNNSSRDR